MRILRHLGKVVALASIIFFAGATVALAGSTTTKTFTNTTGQAVNDLHVEFNTAVTVESQDPAGTFGDTSGEGTSSVDFSNGSVANGGSVKIKFKGAANSTRVKKWWWTNDGNRVGPKETASMDDVLGYLDAMDVAIEANTMSIDSFFDVFYDTVGEIDTIVQRLGALETEMVALELRSAQIETEMVALQLRSAQIEIEMVELSLRSIEPGASGFSGGGGGGSAGHGGDDPGGGR